MRFAFRPLAVAFALLAPLTLAAPQGLAAQDDDDLCSGLLDPINRQITENWDDLAALTVILNTWTTGIQMAFSIYEPGRLEEMSSDEIEKEKRLLVELRDCLPRIAMTFDRLKKRIEELQNAPGVVGSDDRLRRQRIAKFRELEQLHSEVGAALDAILG